MIPTQQFFDLQESNNRMARLFGSMINHGGHLLAAIDFETTGRDPSWHEIIQVAIVPLDAELRPCKEVPAFNRFICPDHPERAEKASLHISGMSLTQIMRTSTDAEQVADIMRDWFLSLDLPIGCKLIPLAHNWAFEKGFAQAWLDSEGVDAFFHFHPRDTMAAALLLNDIARTQGQVPPFPHVGLGALCRALGVVNYAPHNALADALATAECYRRLMESFRVVF
jgi:DNA polymerase III epsilon subunit-like protein